MDGGTIYREGSKRARCLGAKIEIFASTIFSWRCLGVGFQLSRRSEQREHVGRAQAEERFPQLHRGRGRPQGRGEGSSSRMGKGWVEGREESQPCEAEHRL